MKRIVIATAAIFAMATGMPAKAAPDAQALFIDTFDTPVYVTGAPGAASNTLLFVVEQRGVIRVLDGEVTDPVPFLDISSRVSFGGERGLLSVAFDPNYQTNRLFYVAFTNRNGDVEIDEFKRRATNAKRADPGTARRVLLIPHRDASNHNGGQLQFGPGGLLYISTGDGGASTPTGARARDLKSLLGKILRINPKQQGTRAYTIPSDNPFVNTANRKEIYAYGLRNPWRFSFDGIRIAIADVGQGQFEEVNFLTAATIKGANFGWPQYEGRQVFDNTQPGPGPAKLPIYVYSHNRGCAIIGGYISHDHDMPALANRYLFGDLCDGRIFSMLLNVHTQQATGVRYTGITAASLSSFGVGPNNRMYFTQTTGELSRIGEPH
jgi:glucose/arabinose dehydrogenase